MTVSRPGLVLAYLRLCRLPNVFTALSDVMMGYLVARQSFAPLAPFACCLAASAALYTAGMVLNDVCDREIDARERPERPLPSGRIPVATATWLGFGLLVAGLLSGAAAGFVGRTTGWWVWRPAAIAGALAGSVLLYDGLLKRTPAGPLGMGLCRFLNVLLGMSSGPILGAVDRGGFGPHQLLAAAGIGTYIVGVTWFARQEADTSHRGHLLGGLVVMFAGLALLFAMHLQLPPSLPPQLKPVVLWAVLLGGIGVTLVRRCGAALRRPEPRVVQAAIKHCILTLIVLDASVALDVVGPAAAICILALLLPALVLGRWVYST